MSHFSILCFCNFSKKKKKSFQKAWQHIWLFHKTDHTIQHSIPRSAKPNFSYQIPSPHTHLHTWPKALATPSTSRHEHLNFGIAISSHQFKQSTPSINRSSIDLLKSIEIKSIRRPMCLHTSFKFLKSKFTHPHRLRYDVVHRLSFLCHRHVSPCGTPR